MPEMDSILDKRSRWQNETLKELQEKMWNTKSIHNLSSAQKNVMVYGLPQVGKTTLILKILGIREDNGCSQNLEKILRAGIEYGNSSTSTAIMYLHSNNDDFGISFKKFEEGIKKPEYFSTESAFEEKIRDVRKEVESGNREVDIMCIYIPRKYFRENNNAFGIDILDVPGVKSKNQKEKNHLNKIMSHCFRLLDVCIIVCQSYKITELGKKLEYISDYANYWFEQPDKFIIVTTYSYKNETVISKIKENSAYLNGIKRFYEDEIKKILGENNKIDVFPLELGTSLQFFKNDHPDYAKAIDETCNSILEQLIETIKAKKHDTLDKIVSSIKSELYSVITNQKVKLEDERKNLRKRIKELDKGLQECQNRIKSHRTEIENLNNERKILRELRKLSPDMPENFSISPSYFNTFGNFKDKDKKFSEDLKEALQEIRTAYINKFNEKVQDDNEKLDANCISISDIIDDQLDNLFYELYPVTILDRLKKSLNSICNIRLMIYLRCFAKG
ncbi:MAG: hypothetical protein NC485_10775 [Ruminococcus flavefaciens]|nr:hypothetical protein [Ruminococcus flavefaciens]MCM1060907.1 hypothetical protein [Eubacterium sp.]